MISPNSLKKLKSQARNPKSAQIARQERQVLLHLNSAKYTPFQKYILKQTRPIIRDGYLTKETIANIRKRLQKQLNHGTSTQVLQILRLLDDIRMSAQLRNRRNNHDRMFRVQNTGHRIARQFSANRSRVFREMFPEIRNLNRSGAYKTLYHQDEHLH